jgi:hypothetical protein
MHEFRNTVCNMNEDRHAMFGYGVTQHPNMQTEVLATLLTAKGGPKTRQVWKYAGRNCFDNLTYS